MSASVASDEVMPGDRIGRYLVLRRLATGGMAEIYLARQEGPKGFSKLVVLKRVLAGFQSTEKFVEMFLDEGRLSARLSHPNIAQTFELDEHGGTYHLAMEYVPGESLARLVKRAVIDARAIAAGSVLRIAMQLLEALEYAHDLKGERGEWLKVVHRDVSPTNVIVSYHGSVKLLDFGIARAASHEHQTQIGTVKGKGGYMSPEQAIAGPVDQRTDVYAVGALLYLLTTGVGPFDDAGNVFAMMRAAVEARFPRPSERNRGVSPQLELIILKAMATRPDERYPTAGAMLSDLEAFAAAQRLSTGPHGLAALMRQLFPDAAELARAYDQAPDEAVVDKLAQSFADLDDEDEVPSLPTRLARRQAGSRPDDAPVGASMSSVGTDKTAVPQGVGRGSAAPAQTKTPTGQRAVAVAGKASGESAEPRTVKAGALIGPVPGAHPAERDTHVVAVPFTPAGADADDDKTVAHFVPEEAANRTLSQPALAHSTREARTISAEHSFSLSPNPWDSPGPPEVTTVNQTEVGAPRSYRDVADIVSRNPWAFVGAGLGAVFLGVLMLWFLSG